MESPVYLDYNATTPVDPEVAAFMRPFLADNFGNPSSIHLFGTKARKAIEEARIHIANFINCFPDEIIFTSGGTESNNHAIKGAAYQNRNSGNHIITSAIEHPAVTEVCRFLETEGFRVTWLEVDNFGMVNPDDIEKAIIPGTILISVMHANNETGTIQPIEDIGRIARAHGILFHSDAAQSAGKIEIDVKKMGVDLLSLAGHKFYAPKGTGALFIRRGTRLQKLMHGATHEGNRRAGTENVPEIAGLGKAAEIARRDFDSNTSHMLKMRELLYSMLKSAIPGIKLNGHPEHRLPNTLYISFPGMEANTLLDDLSTLAASAGAACHGEHTDISPVLSAMKVPLNYAMGTIRFSTGKYNSENEIVRSAKTITETVKRLGYKETVDPDMDHEEGTVRLTRFTHGLGCACKIRPQYLEMVLKDLPMVFDRNILVGTKTSDDAAVYRLNDTTALVQSVDFFTPIVDDPYEFGSIAAANALSDIYAMGAKPLFALNIVGFPSNRLPMQVLKDILRGAADKCSEAGIQVLGGHTVEDTEPKFGMVITGTVHPGKFITNAGAQKGDVLILTKPLGTGIISTAVKRGQADEVTVRTAIEVMGMLNKDAATVMEQFPVNACTDITGFGLLGHLKEMVTASGVHVHIDQSRIPLISAAAGLAAAGAVPGGTRNNLEFVSDVVEWPDDISDIMKLLLCDAQTSGGLLISLPGKFEPDFVRQLKETYNITGTAIGIVVGTGSPKISIE
jgi:cysteine desulfurase